MRKAVLGIGIDDINIDQALDVIKKWLEVGGKHYIVTPNPEIVVMSQKDKEFRKILNKADLAIPDGIGLKLSGDIVCHIPGIDLMEEIVKLSLEKGFTIGLLGGKEGIAKKVAKCLKKKYPKLKVIFAESGGEIDQNALSKPYNSSSPSLRASGLNPIPHSDILFVAFGPPKQEKWIAKNLNKYDIKVAMGVGGAFDYISGRVPRAPLWIRNLGFEWLFRLIIEPWRIKRQLALIKYLLMIL